MKIQKNNTVGSANSTLGIGIVTPVYDLLVDVAGWGTSFQKKLVTICSITPNEKLADIGSGTGTFCILAKRFRRTAKITGIDPDDHIIEIAKRKTAKEHLSIEYIQSLAQDLPFRSNSLDIVVSSLAFHHIPGKDKDLACQEIYRVLKPGGHFLLADFGPSNKILIKLFFAVGHLLRFEDKEYAKENLNGSLPDIMKRAGFKVKEAAPMQKGIQILLGVK